jgi:hypothetical protein
MNRRHTISHTYNKNLLKCNDKKNLTYSVIDTKEIKKYIEQVQYKIKANDNAINIAKCASFSAKFAVENAINAINTAIVLKNIINLSNRIKVTCKDINNEMEFLLINLKLLNYKNQINYLYYAVDSITNKPVSPKSTNSIATQITIETMSENSIQDIDKKKNEKRRNDQSYKFLCYKFSKKSKSSKIYNLQNKSQNKSSNLFISIIKKICLLDCINGISDNIDSDSDSDSKSYYNNNISNDDESNNEFNENY